ncbi:hypothetical protein ACHAXR_000729 [Thalassiosira sp. AJA248-18]
MSPSRAAAAAAIILSITASNYSTSHAFIYPSPSTSKHVARTLSHQSPMTTRTINPNNLELRPPSVLQMAATTSDEDLKKEISALRAKEIRQELESYGISTKSFFEKSEMVEALVKARQEGKTPIDTGVNGEVNGDAAATNVNGDSSSSSSSTTSTADRKERLEKEMETCKKMKVGELKKELESYGISTKSFFEKSEFVRAVAEVRVDGPPKKSSTGPNGASGRVEEEPRDPSYRDVVVTKFQGQGMLGGGKLIDVRAR